MSPRAGLILSNRSGANCVNLGSAGQRRWAAGAPTGAALAAAAYPFAVAFAARFAPLRPHRRVRSWTRVLAWVARSRGAPTPRARSRARDPAAKIRQKEAARADPGGRAAGRALCRQPLRFAWSGVLIRHPGAPCRRRCRRERGVRWTNGKRVTILDPDLVL